MNLNKKNLTDIDLAGKRVLMRVDFNVPMEGGQITNNQRILGAIPTIEYALEKGAKSVVLMSHLGRPDGNVKVSESLKPVATRLEELLKKPVTFLSDCVGPEVEEACKDPVPGSVILLENLRFHVEEEGKGIVHVAPCPGKKCEKHGGNCKAEKATPEQTNKFRKSLTSLGDVYVNDAFGTAHRAHSSMVGVDLPDKVAGLLIQKELAAFSEVLTAPKKPLVAIVGGAKISDKIKLIDNILEKADGIIICGGMAYTFLKVCYGMEIGNSLFDKAGAAIVQGILDKAKEKGVEVTFPIDWICGKEFKNDQELKTVTQEEGIPDGWEGMDCGPKSIELFQEVIKKANTVVWNGPAGVFEFENFSKGTNGILDAVAKLHAAGGRGIIGGGDSATAAANADMEDKVSFVSTGGGASLELLEGKLLPGIEALANKPTEPKVVTAKGSTEFAQPLVEALRMFGADEQVIKQAVIAVTADNFLIDSIKAREILDSRGNPTVEVDLRTKGGISVRACVPSGASTGIHEAVELRDGDKSRYLGKGVTKAVQAVNEVLAPELRGHDVSDQWGLDRKMNDIDGTVNKGKLGANAILGVSLAAAKAAAQAKGVPLYKHFADLAGNSGPMVLPVPCFNVVNGGSHAGNKLAFQEYFIIPVGAATFKEAMQIGAECYHALKAIIKKKFGGDATLIGDEGGFAPPCDAREGVTLIMEAIEAAGYMDKCSIGMDVAASEFKVEGEDCYDLGTWYPEAERKPELKMTGAELGAFYAQLCKEFPIITIEDPFDQDDWAAWSKMTDDVGTPCQIVGDDLTVTNVTRVQRAIDDKACNALLLKVNQIGTVTESIEAVKLCKKNGWGVMTSHRSGETEDTIIADLAVGLCTGQIKTGAPCRSERNAKYNQLMRIEEELGASAVYAGKTWRKPQWMAASEK